MRRKGVWLAALLATALALLLFWVALVPPAPQPPSPSETGALLPVVIDFQRPLQTLYRLQSRAVRVGWTVESALAAGDAWAALGDSRRALAYWEIALQQNAQPTAVLARLANGYWEQEQWSAALVTLKRLLASDPADRAARLRLGTLQAIFDPQAAALTLAESDAPSAAALLAAAQGDANDVPRLMRVGLTLAGDDNWAMAEAAFEYAASFSPPDGLAAAYWGLARDRVGKDGAAQIAAAVALLPANAQVHYLQGLHLRLVGDAAGSLQSLRTAAELDAENPAYAAELSAAYEQAGNVDAAQIWLRRAVALAEGDVRFSTLLDEFYQRFPALKQ